MIRVFQCKQDCCIVQVPSKRFWYVGFYDCEKDTVTSFAAAMEAADKLRNTIPMEVTA